MGSVHICLKGEYAKTGNDAQKMIHANTEDDTLKDDTLTEQLAMQLAMQHQVAMALKKRLVEESLAKKNTGQATARAERQADEAVWSKTNGEQEAAKKIMKEAVKWRVSPDKDREAYVNQCLECLLEEHALAVEANVQGRARSPVSNIRVTQNMLKEVVEDLIMELAEEMVVVEVMEVMMEEVVEEEEVVKESGDRLQEEVGCGMVQVADVGEEEMKGLVIEVIKKMNVMEFMMNFVVDVVEELGQDKDSVSGCVCVDSVFETGSPEDVAKHVGQLMKSVVCGTGENLMDGLVEEIVMDCVGSEVGENLMLELAEEMVVIEVMEVMIEAEDEEVQEFARSIGGEILPIVSDLFVDASSVFNHLKISKYAEIKQPKSPVRMCGLRLDTKSLEILQGDSSREKRRETEDRALKSREHQTRLFGQSQQTQNPLRMSESQHDTQSLEKSHADTRGEAKEKTSEIATESAVRMGFLPEVSQSKSVSRASQNLENSLAPKLTFSQRSSGPAKRAAPNQLRNNDVNTSPVVLRKTETSIPEANKRRDLVPPKARLDRVPDHPSQQLQPTNSLKQAALATSLSPLLALVISSSQNDTASRITEAGPSLHRAKVVSPQTPRSFHRAPLAEPEQTLSPLQPMSPAYAKPNISGLSTGRALPSSNLGAETQAETQGAKVPKVRSSPPAQPSKPSSPSVDRIAREEENRGLVKKAVKKAVKEMGEDLMIELAVEVVKMVYQEALQQVRDDNGFQLSKQSRDRGRDRYGDRSRKSTPQSAKRDARVDALLQLQWSQEDRLEQDRLLPTKSGHRLFETISRDQDSVSHGDKYRGQPVTMPRAEARLNGAADTMRKHSPVMADRSPRDSRDASQDGERTFSASPPVLHVYQCVTVSSASCPVRISICMLV